MKKPTRPEPLEWLAETIMGSDTILAEYDHNSDNYQISLNGVFVWGSDGDNRHDIAEHVYRAVVAVVENT